MNVLFHLVTLITHNVHLSELRLQDGIRYRVRIKSVIAHSSLREKMAEVNRFLQLEVSIKLFKIYEKICKINWLETATCHLIENTPKCCNASFSGMYCNPYYP